MAPQIFQERKKMMDWHYYILFLLGIVFGVIVANLRSSHKAPTVGNWHINESDPEKDIFRIEFTQHPSTIYECKQVMFNVIREKNIGPNG